MGILWSARLTCLKKSSRPISSQSSGQQKVIELRNHVLGKAAMNNYAKFGAMIATSAVVMLGLMYLNTYQLDHIFLVKQEPTWHS